MHFVNNMTRAFADILGGMSARASVPLRRGPAAPAAQDEIRTRILDAATRVLFEAGVSGRLHAQIAKEAGVSRPTVYKYVGDQPAILDAVFEREFQAFLAAVLPQLRKGVTSRSSVIDGVALIVDYGRNHALLQKSLREQPEFVLPALTTECDALLDRTVALFSGQLGEFLGDERKGRLAAEWLFRLIVSLIITPGHSGATRRDIQRHLESLVDLLG